MGILGKFYRQYKIRKNPVKFWKLGGVKIGSDCEIYPSVSFGSEPYLVEIGNHVRITDGVKFITHDGGVWVLRGLKDEYKDIDLFGKITVGDNVHIGMDVTIMPGVKIGSNCVIGCGAIVTKDIPDNSIAVGVPAKVIKTIDEYEANNKEEFMHTKGMNSKDKKEFILKNL